MGLVVGQLSPSAQARSSIVILRPCPGSGYGADMLNLQGKHALIFGVASEESIAWAIAKKFHQAGARISLGYQQRFKSRVLQLVKSGEIPVAYYERCDVTNPEELNHFFSRVEEPVDVLVHSIAYASPESLGKPITEITQE